MVVHNMNGLPIQVESTPFRLTNDELNVITNTQYEDPKNNYTSISSNNFLLKDTRLSRIKNFLDERVNNYVENVVEIKDKLVMTQSWTTITKKNKHHHSHNHRNSIFSLVFYVSAEGEKSGNIVFDHISSRLEEKSSFAFTVKNYNYFNSRSWEYEVHTGDLIIFPSWTFHFTKENTSDKDRIIIGANYFVEGVLGELKNVDKINIQLGDVND